MSPNDTDSDSDGDVSTLESRTRRALQEDMTVALCKAGGVYTVTGESGSLYLVDVSRGTCTCPDQQKDSVDRCKHLRRVDIELRKRTIPTPDGRLSTPVHPVADGGTSTTATDRVRPGTADRIEGSLYEFDKFDRLTGVHYYRCRSCGSESLHRQDLEGCCLAEEIDS